MYAPHFDVVTAALRSNDIAPMHIITVPHGEVLDAIVQRLSTHGSRPRPSQPASDQHEQDSHTREKLRCLQTKPWASTRKQCGHKTTDKARAPDLISCSRLNG